MQTSPCTASLCSRLPNYVRLANRRVPKGPAVLRSNTLICSKTVGFVRGCLQTRSRYACTASLCRWFVRKSKICLRSRASKRSCARLRVCKLPLANFSVAFISEAVLANRRVPKGPAVLRSNTLICSKSVAKVRKTVGFVRGLQAQRSCARRGLICK